MSRRRQYISTPCSILLLPTKTTTHTQREREKEKKRIISDRKFGKGLAAKEGWQQRSTSTESAAARKDVEETDGATGGRAAPWNRFRAQLPLLLGDSPLVDCLAK